MGGSYLKSTTIGVAGRATQGKGQDEPEKGQEPTREPEKPFLVPALHGALMSCHELLMSIQDSLRGEVGTCTLRDVPGCGWSESAAASAHPGQQHNALGSAAPFMFSNHSSAHAPRVPPPSRGLTLQKGQGLQTVSLLTVGRVEWWSGGVVEWWSGGVVEWWSGGSGGEWWEWWSGWVHVHTVTGYMQNSTVHCSTVQCMTAQCSTRVPEAREGSP